MRNLINFGIFQANIDLRNQVWRFCNILPVTVPKSSSCPIKVGSYEIPANTHVTMSTYSVHMDQAYWGDPENIPFGIGKRRCAGETVARTENFLFLANLMKNFSFGPGLDGKVPELRPLARLTNGPQPFLTKVTMH